tara:strand:- start:3166 stop:4422 length:1257 start_codon:yes stop_codon:yes gene_type:complete
MNWISFVKDYQSKNNISFKKAMKEAAPSYRKMKEGTVEPNKKIKIVKDKKEPVKKKVIKIKKDKKEEPNKELKKKVLKLVKDNKKNKSKVKETQKIGLDLASKLASKIGIRENISSDFITQQLLKIKKEQEEKEKAKEPVINEGTLSYPNIKGEMMRIRLPKFDEVFLKKPLRDLGKDREDFLEGKYLIKKIGGGLYKSFTEKEIKKMFPQNSANAIINYNDKYRKKIIFKREAKAKEPVKSEKELSEFTKEEVEEKYKDLGEFQKNNNKILDRAQFILTKDKNKIDKMIEIYKKIDVKGRKGVSSNFNEVRYAIREKLERDQNNCESLINSLRTKINFIKKKGSKKDLPFGHKTIKGFLNEGHELIKKNSSCLNKKQLEEIKNLGIVTKTSYNTLTDTIKEEKEVKDEFLKLYPSKK